jgi:hypothetical protein
MFSANIFYEIITLATGSFAASGVVFRGVVRGRLGQARREDGAHRQRKDRTRDRRNRSGQCYT